MASLKDFKVEIGDISFVGSGLCRPESVVACRDGTLYCSDTRGVATRIGKDGSMQTLGNACGEPNGLAMDAQGILYNANFGLGRFDKVYPDGRTETLLSEFDGKALPRSCNYIYPDHGGVFWLSISTVAPHFFETARTPAPDGIILRMDKHGVRQVAGDLYMANEVRPDPSGQWLYVAETTACRMTRYRIGKNGDLHERQQFGPDLPGYPDGYAWDIEGNLWISMPIDAALVVIPPSGVELWTVFRLPASEQAIEHFYKVVDEHTLTEQDFGSVMGGPLPALSSVAFGGADRRTLYMGSLVNSRLASLRVPVAGAPMPHWP